MYYSNMTFHAAFDEFQQMDLKFQKFQINKILQGNTVYIDSSLFIIHCLNYTIFFSKCVIILFNPFLVSEKYTIIYCRIIH